MTNINGSLVQIICRKSSFRQISLFLLIFLLGIRAQQMPLFAADSVESFIIIDETLKKYKKEKFPQSLLTALNPILNRFYTSKEEFLKALKQLKNFSFKPNQLEVILKHAIRKDSWLLSNGVTLDLKTGESVLTGNVRGGFPKEDITFTADKGRVVTEGSQRFNKFVLENNVHIWQSKRDITADRVIYNRTSQLLDLVGNIVVVDKQQGVTLNGETATLNQQQEKIEVRGQNNSNTKQRVRVEYHPKQLAGSEKSAGIQPDVILAEQAVLDNKQRKSTFEGNVELDYPQRNLYMTAGSILLIFDEKQELLSSHAEQNVCIEQPGRAARADTADIDEPKQTIHLEGNFKMSRGGIYMDAPRFTLFLDVEKGEAVGDSESPIRMILPLDEPSSKQVPNSQLITCR
ncbi:MAG: hypothetical protein HQM13_15830 [SAR324 cluster bacterium]|nr:hypothetical protein [SAR324 cluster bacterium]